MGYGRAIVLAVCLVAFTSHAGGLSGARLSTFITPAPSSGPAITNTTSGLVNWWKFDENTGTSAADSSGSATGTFAGTPNPTWIAGKINSALNFDGADAGAYVQLAANLISGSSGLTVSAWVFPTNNASFYLLYDSDNDTSKGFWINLNQGSSSLDVNFEAVFDSVDTTRETRDAPVPLNAWTHLIITWAGSTPSTGVHIYTNSVEDTEYSLTGQNGSGSHAANTTTDRFIGRAHAATENRPAGRIDDLRVYNRVINAGERANIYQWTGQP